ncbi:hypothetical protein ACFQOZ_20595 [Comamonas endophytica]
MKKESFQRFNIRLTGTVGPKLKVSRSFIHPAFDFMSTTGRTAMQSGMQPLMAMFATKTSVKKLKLEFDK